MAKLDETRVRNMEFMLRNTRYPELLEESARCIQINIYQRLKKRKQMKEMRDKMKDLPYVVRNGFVKMQLLKMDTAALGKNAKRQFSAIGGRRK